jgi:hypothetical protein
MWSIQLSIQSREDGRRCSRHLVDAKGDERAATPSQKYTPELSLVTRALLLRQLHAVPLIPEHRETG